MAAETPTIPAGETGSYRRPGGKNPFLPGNRPSDKKTAQLPNSLADQLKKVGDRNRNLSNELKKHGYDQKQFEQDDQHFQKVYNEWKWLLRHIPGLSRGTLESQQIALDFRHPTAPDGWGTLPGKPPGPRPRPS